MREWVFKQRSLRIFKQFTKKRLSLKDREMEMEMMRETKIMLKLADEFMDKMTHVSSSSGDTVMFRIPSTASWKDTKQYAVDVCKHAICSENTCTWGRTIAACTYALEVIRERCTDYALDNDDEVETIAKWLYDDIIHTSWVEKRGWDDFIYCFSRTEEVEEESKFLNFILSFIPLYYIIYIYCMLFD